MASSLGLHTTVEGVETEEQYYFLREMGCTDLQGFLFSKPVPADAIFADKAAKKKPNSKIS